MDPFRSRFAHPDPHCDISRLFIHTTSHVQPDRIGQIWLHQKPTLTLRSRQSAAVAHHPAATAEAFFPPTTTSSSTSASRTRSARSPLRGPGLGSRGRESQTGRSRSRSRTGQDKLDVEMGGPVLSDASASDVEEASDADADADAHISEEDGNLDNPSPSPFPSVSSSSMAVVMSSSDDDENVTFRPTHVVFRVAFSSRSCFVEVPGWLDQVQIVRWNMRSRKRQRSLLGGGGTAEGLEDDDDDVEYDEEEEEEEEEGEEEEEEEEDGESDGQPHHRYRHRRRRKRRRMPGSSSSSSENWEWKDGVIYVAVSSIVFFLGSQEIDSDTPPSEGEEEGETETEMPVFGRQRNSRFSSTVPLPPSVLAVGDMCFDDVVSIRKAQLTETNELLIQLCVRNFEEDQRRRRLSSSGSSLAGEEEEEQLQKKGERKLLDGLRCRVEIRMWIRAKGRSRVCSVFLVFGFRGKGEVVAVQQPQNRIRWLRIQRARGRRLKERFRFVGILVPESRNVEVCTTPAQFSELRHCMFDFAARSPLRVPPSRRIRLDRRQLLSRRALVTNLRANAKSSNATASGFVVPPLAAALRITPGVFQHGLRSILSGRRTDSSSAREGERSEPRKGKKAVLIIVIGNGVDASNVPKDRVTVISQNAFRKKSLDDSADSGVLSPDQRRLVLRQTHALLRLIECAPFCPIIYYDINDGRPVAGRDILVALHFVFERARLKQRSSNVVIVTTWAIAVNERVEELDSAFATFERLDNVVIVASAGNQAQDLDLSIVYPPSCVVCRRRDGKERKNSCIITVGALDPEAPEPTLLECSNFGEKTVDCYVEGPSTGLCAVVVASFLSFLWLLDPGCSSGAIRNLVMKKGCEKRVCAVSNRDLVTLSRADDALAELMISRGGEEPEMDVGFWSEMLSFDEDLESELDDEETDESAVSKSFFDPVADAEDDLRSYLLSVKKVHSVIHDLCRDVDFNVETAMFPHVPEAKTLSRLLLDGTLCRVYVSGPSASGKTVLGRKILCEIASARLESDRSSQEAGLTSSLPVPFYVSYHILRRVKTVDCDLDAVLHGVFTEQESTMWNANRSRLLIVDDFDSDGASLLTSIPPGVKIVVLSRLPLRQISTTVLSVSFHPIHIQALSKSAIISFVKKEFSKKTFERVFELLLSDVVTPFRCNFMTVSSLIFADAWLEDTPFVTYQVRKDSYLVVQRVIESLSYEFIDSIESIGHRTKSVLKKITVAVLSLLAFRLLRERQETFRVIGIQERAYSSYVRILERHLDRFPLFTKIPELDEYRFSAPLFAKFLAAHHIRNTLNSMLMEMKHDMAAWRFLSVFHETLYDPFFYDVVNFLQRTSSPFREVCAKQPECISFKELEKLRVLAVDSHQEKGVDAAGGRSEGDFHESFRLRSDAKKRLLRAALQLNSQSERNKLEISRQLVRSHRCFTTVESNRIVRVLLSSLARENDDATLQQHFVDVVCRFAHQVSPSVLKTVLHTLRLLASVSEMRSFVIAKFVDVAALVDFSATFLFFRKLFSRFEDVIVRKSILSVLTTLAVVHERQAVLFSCLQRVFLPMIGEQDSEFAREITEAIVVALASTANSRSRAETVLSMIGTGRVLLSKIGASGIAHELSSKPLDSEHVVMLFQITNRVWDGWGSLETRRVDILRNLLVVSVLDAVVEGSSPVDLELCVRILEPLFEYLTSASAVGLCKTVANALEHVVRRSLESPSLGELRAVLLERIDSCLHSHHLNSPIGGRLIEILGLLVSGITEPDSFVDCVYHLISVVVGEPLISSCRDLGRKVIIRVCRNRSIPEISVILERLVRILAREISEEKEEEEEIHEQQHQLQNVHPPEELEVYERGDVEVEVVEIEDVLEIGEDADAIASPEHAQQMRSESRTTSSRRPLVNALTRRVTIQFLLENLYYLQFRNHYENGDYPLIM